MARMQGLSLAGGNRGLLIIAAIAGIAAAVLFIAAVNSGGDGSSTPLTAETATVVVAARDITTGQQIESTMVEVKSVQSGDVIEGAFSDSNAVVGQRARALFLKGEQLTLAKVGPPPEGKGIGWVLPTDKVAVGVEVSETTQVGGNLLAGDRVDLLVTFQPTEPGAPVAVYTVVRNVEVLSVAQEAQEAVTAAQDAPAATESAASSGQVPEDVEKQPSATTVTVALSAEQAQLLACVQDHPNVGRVWLTLRAFGASDTGEATTVPPGCQLNS